MSTAVLHAVPSSPHAGRIEFGHTRRSQGGWAGTATIDFDGETWATDLDMSGPYVADMVGFFEEIARPDWSGATRWQSEFQELAIEAAAADGLVELAVSVWWSAADELDNELIGRDEMTQFAARLREVTHL